MEQEYVIAVKMLWTEGEIPFGAIPAPIRIRPGPFQVPHRRRLVAAPQ